MRIHIVGDGLDEFKQALKPERIEFATPGAKSGGLIFNVAGDSLEVMAPATAIVFILRAWLKANSARKISVTFPDGRVIDTQGIGPKEFDEVVKSAQSLTLIHPKAKK